MNTDTARNGIEAAERIAALQPDLAFLDIQMPGLTGLEVAQGIEGATRVVFVTAYDEYAVEAFEQEALDYVLKPVKTERLQRTLERIQRAFAMPATEPEPAREDARLLAALKRLLPTSNAAGAPAERLGGCAPARANACSRSQWTRCSTSMPTTNTPACAPRWPST